MPLEQCRLDFYTWVDVVAPAGLGRVLDVLEDPKWGPTLVDEHEPATSRYDRRELLEAAGRPGRSGTSLQRTKSPQWSATAKPLAQGLFLVGVEWGDLSAANRKLPFLVGDRLAEVLSPVFGFVHPVLTGVGKLWNQVSARESRHFLTVGPRGVCARTWLGPELVALFGEAKLRKLPILVRDGPRGGLRLDLTAAPWSDDRATLAKTHEKVMSSLRQARVFGDYSVFNKPKARPGWKTPTPPAV